jgi:hypothetical protein
VRIFIVVPFVPFVPFGLLDRTRLRGEVVAGIAMQVEACFCESCLDTLVPTLVLGSGYAPETIARLAREVRGRDSGFAEPQNAKGVGPTRYRLQKAALDYAASERRLTCLRTFPSALTRSGLDASSASADRTVARDVRTCEREIELTRRGKRLEASEKEQADLTSTILGIVLPVFAVKLSTDRR